MTRLPVIAASLLCGAVLSLNAADAKPEKKQMTREQKQLYKEIVARYDANKDGKLDKDERAKISQEDKEKMEKAGIPMGGRKKKQQ